jgi:hypothetical protein
MFENVLFQCPGFNGKLVGEIGPPTGNKIGCNMKTAANQFNGIQIPAALCALILRIPETVFSFKR